MKMPSSITFTAGVLAGALVTAGLAALWPKSDVQVATHSSTKVVLENDRVRVKEAIFAPGDADPMHTHELPHVGIVIDGGKLVFNYADGTTENLDLPRGGVGYRDANVTHQAVNPGREPVRVIEVEIK
jgi:mannose-6-phosphate isomerase-like protein (cupin superfamily)